MSKLEVDGEWLVAASGVKHYFPSDHDSVSVCSSLWRKDAVVNSSGVVRCDRCLCFDHAMSGDTERKFFTELLDARSECRHDGIEWCRMESVLARFMRKCCIGFVCPHCDYPMPAKPENKLCERCFQDVSSDD